MRATMDQEALNELAGSIRLQGIIQPLLVTRVAEPSMPSSADALALSDWRADCDRRGYEIIDGHRRYLAAALCGLHELPCLIFDNVGDAKLAMMHASNVFREDVTAAEEGLHYLEMVEKHGWGMAELMKFFRRSEDYINSRTDLWRRAPEVAQAVVERKINFAVSKELMKVQQAEDRAYMLDYAITHGISAHAMQIMRLNRARDRALESLPPAEPAAATSLPLPTLPQPACLWCGRDDEQHLMASVPVHHYHVRDLRWFLERCQINRPIALALAPRVEP